MKLGDLTKPKQYALEVLDMFLHKQCDLERTKFAYSQNEVFEAVKMSKEALEEVEQYRALGTVEGFQKALDSSLEYYNQMKEYKAKLQEYEAIGTVEELKEAREKQVAKKPIMKTVVFCDEAEDVCVCSVCESEIGLCKGQPYCENCGSKVDWGEEDD